MWQTPMIEYRIQGADAAFDTGAAWLSLLKIWPM
jgi:hypothetical protein